MSVLQPVLLVGEKATGEPVGTHSHQTGSSGQSTVSALSQPRTHLHQVVLGKQVLRHQEGPELQAGDQLEQQA